MDFNKKTYCKVHKLVKIVSLSVFLILTTFINDKYIRAYYSSYTNQLRLVDHLLAGICIPLILYLILGKFYKKCCFYLTWCSYWEVSQYIHRGYFQYLQYIFDLIGIGIAVAIYLLKNYQKK